MEPLTQAQIDEEARQQWIASVVEQGVNVALGPLQAQVADLQQRLEEALAQPPPTVPAATTPPAAPEGPTAEPPRAEAPALYIRTRPLPDPAKFSGKRSDYAAWQQEMRDKLLLDQHLYPTAYEQWYLIGRCLEAGPKRVVETYYAQGGNGGRRDPHDLMDYLDSVYKDVNAAARAANALRTLRQRDSDTFAYFLTRFEQTIAQAGGTSWADSAKITFLEGALNEPLRRALVAVALPDEFGPWVRRVQEVAGRLEALKSGRRAELPARRQGSGRDNDGDVAMTGVNKLGERNKGRGSESGASSGNAGNKQRSSPDTRRCYRCQEVGHIARNCSRPSNPRAARTREESDAEEEYEHLEEGEDDEESSGKE